MKEYRSSVSVPPGYFLKNVSHCYNNMAFALVRELVQNALDAGATLLEFNFSDEGYTFRDNGHGMTSAVIRQGFLAMGGSIKGQNATGGFGEAKVLLCFAAESFRIRSRTCLVEGAGMQYHMVETDDDYPGTEISCTFQKEWPAKKEEFERASLRFAGLAQFSARFLVNGQWFKTTERTIRPIRELPFLVAYEGGPVSNADNVIVRHNGVPMFTSHVQGLKKVVICEITRHGRELLTSNRDGFIHIYGRQFNEFLIEIGRDTESFKRQNPVYTEFKGGTGPQDDPAKNEAGNTAASVMSENDGELYEDLRQRMGEIVLVNDLSSYAGKIVAEAGQENTTERIGAVVEALRDVLTEDFIIATPGNMTDIPKRFHPQTFSAPVERLALEWKSAVRLVMRANRLTFPYRIGFILMDDRWAEFSRGEDRCPRLLLNPKKILEKGERSKDRFIRLIILASHEIAHREFPYHGESHTIVAEKLLLKALQSGNLPSLFKAELKKTKIRRLTND
jgi:hypothetical protein